jgi:D-inositol-3-phosphate glycosyltransferase
VRAVEHARAFSWDRTTDALLATYAEAAAEFRAGLVRTSELAG